MSHKRGQIGIFLIIAVLILAAGSLYFFYSPKSREAATTTGFEDVGNFINTCLKDSAEEGIYFISLQGGYYNAPEESLPFVFIQIPYYWHLGNGKMPEKETIEMELSRFIGDAFQLCVNNFTAFREIGYDVEYENPSVSSKIAENNVLVGANFPVKINSKTGSKEFNNFNSIIDINLNKKYNYAKQIIEEQKKDANTIPLGFLAELAYDSNFTFEYVYMGDGDVIYSLIFNESLGNVLIYAFAAKYSWGNATISQPIRIADIPEFSLTEPKVINYKVEAFGKNLTFYDYTDLFDINPKTGQINFDAFDASNGNYNVLIKIVDGRGNEAFTIMRISINYNNKLPIIEPIGNLTAFAGQEFSYKVKASDPINNYLFFLDDTSLFNINVQTGEIKFTPAAQGNYTIKIIATNEAGSGYEYFNLEVR